MRKHRGFTLIELMVVVSIIALLAGILMPSLKEVRRVSKRTACQKHLKEIGTGMQAYLQVHQDIFPYCARLPSFEREQAKEKGVPPLPSLPEALRRELGAGSEVFQCPADRNSKLTQGADAIPADRYFDHEGTSYEWESLLNGLRLGFKLVRIYADTGDGGPYVKPIEIFKTDKKNVWMAYDFEAFHGGERMRGSHNVLYTDLHVQHDNWNKDKVVGQELKESGGASSMVP